MKSLQNNFTTLEQSERLIEIGVPIDSADLCYEMSYRPIPMLLPEGVDFSNLHKYFDDDDDSDYIPCWSAGRLVELTYKCWVGEMPQKLFPNLKSPRCNMMAYISKSIENNMILGHIDFSKLND